MQPVEETMVQLVSEGLYKLCEKAREDQDNRRREAGLATYPPHWYWLDDYKEYLALTDEEAKKHTWNLLFHEEIEVFQDRMMIVFMFKDFTDTAPGRVLMLCVFPDSAGLSLLADSPQGHEETVRNVRLVPLIKMVLEKLGYTVPEEVCVERDSRY